MKKIILSACALSAMFLTSCSNEVDMFETIGTPKATIELNISNDKEMQVATRATVPSEEYKTWYAKLGDDAQCTVNQLITKTYTEGNYSLQVSNYQNLADALESHDGAGDMFFTKTQQITLKKGTNTIDVECGKAKNSKLTVNWSGTSGVQGLSMTSVEATQTSRTKYTYSDASSDKSAYFKAGEDITCTINYNYNDKPMSLNKTFNNPLAAHEYKLNVSANNNGTITTITINYDNTFDDGGTTDFIINAATGAEVTTPSAK